MLLVHSPSFPREKGFAGARVTRWLWVRNSTCHPNPSLLQPRHPRKPCLHTAPGAVVGSSFSLRWQKVKQSQGCRCRPPARPPAGTPCRRRRGQCKSRWCARSPGVPGSCRGGVSGIACPLSRHSASKDPGEGLRWGKSVRLHQLHPCFGMAEDRTPLKKHRLL